MCGVWAKRVRTQSAMCVTHFIGVRIGSICVTHLVGGHVAGALEPVVCGKWEKRVKMQLAIRHSFHRGACSVPYVSRISLGAMLPERWNLEWDCDVGKEGENTVGHVSLISSGCA